MRELKAGDRVAIYNTGKYTGVIVKVLSDTQCMVQVDELKNVHTSFDAAFHVKQLRRLKPKRKALEFWIMPVMGGKLEALRYKPVCADAVHVKEVLPKRVKP